MHDVFTPQLSWPTLQNQDFLWNDSTMHHIQLHSKHGFKPDTKKKASNNRHIYNKRHWYKTTICREWNQETFDHTSSKMCRKRYMQEFQGLFLDQITWSRNTKQWLFFANPNIKLKYAKCGLFSMGATLYNALPIQIRKIDDFNIFREYVFKLYM